MSFVIEDNVPINASGKQGPEMGELGRTLRKMEPGQSFFVAASECRPNILRSAAQYAKFTTGFKYSVRRQGDGYRVWRLS